MKLLNPNSLHVILLFTIRRFAYSMLMDAQWRDVIGKNSHSITQPNTWSGMEAFTVPSRLRNFIVDAMIYGCRQGQLQSMDPSLSCVGHLVDDLKN